MSMIAAALGGSKSTLYSYFATKSDLFLAIMDRTWNLHNNSLSVSVMKIKDVVNAEEWVKSWVTDFLIHLHADDVIAMHRLIIAEAARFPELARKLFRAGPEMNIIQLGESLALLNERGLLNCDEPIFGARLLRGLSRSVLYEERLWEMAPKPSMSTIEEEAARITLIFMRLYRA